VSMNTDNTTVEIWH